MRKDLKSTFCCSSHGNLRRVDRDVVMQEQITGSQFSLPHSCNFLAKRPQFACKICTVHRATLLKIINHDLTLTIPKIEVITFLAE